MVAVASAIVHLIVDGKGPEYIFCTREDCVFGWMAPQWLQTMLMFSFVVSVCIAGYNYSVYTSPVIAFINYLNLFCRSSSCLPLCSPRWS